MAQRDHNKWRLLNLKMFYLNKAFCLKHEVTKFSMCVLRLSPQVAQNNLQLGAPNGITDNVINRLNESNSS
jgi:hypothetical protein